MRYTDEEIKKNIEFELTWDSEINASNVKVSVSEGKVSLAGTVPSIKASHLCLKDTEQISGVVEVSNLLTVDLLPASQGHKDEDISNKAKTIMMWNSDLDDADISIIVEKGVLTLKGSVNTYPKKNKAEYLLSDLHGIIEIKNKLSLVFTEKKSDKDIAQDVKDAIDRHHLAASVEDITVKVENGYVTLVGEVLSLYAKKKASKLALSSAGVFDVYNSLVITEYNIAVTKNK
ncbi:MAG: BON domain-containing protein [Thermodesulfobacteriota bacterium]|nr:BON domain-containing protein [Thermodesulfobacteriota bacterium]